MIESILVWTIIAVSGFFIGRKFFRQWRAAIDKNGQITCGGGCCSCTTDSSTCTPQKSITKQK